MTQRLTARIATYTPEFLKVLQRARAQPRQLTEAQQKARQARLNESQGAPSQLDLERILNGRNDLLYTNYLRLGLLAARTIARIELPPMPDLPGGGFGTGFLVGPRLLLTNQHVFERLEWARSARATFAYERDVYGLRQPGVAFAFDPEALYVADQRLDYALVAVRPLSDDERTSLDSFGFLRLNAKTGKVLPDECVTIIGHPDGDHQQVALRDNIVLQIGRPGTSQDDFLWYSTDTLSGMSGSPVFNDQWQVVALHHRGVAQWCDVDGQPVGYAHKDGRCLSEAQVQAGPFDDTDFTWIANEGVRISRIVEDLERVHAEDVRQQRPRSLLREWLDDVRGRQSYPSTNPEATIVSRLDTTAPTLLVSPLRDERAERRSLSEYQDKSGYDADFLGTPLPLPEIPQATRERFGPVAKRLDTGTEELTYTNFSVVMNARRRLAYVTAVNIDGAKWRELKRERDVWQFDPRLDEAHQLGNDFYANEPDGNYFDRGHLVRRQDPVWGAGAREANDDTFHWTNCSPQYWEFNQSQRLWQGLENFILFNTDQDDLRATVFTGPVFDERDALHRGVQVPQAYWKLLAVLAQDGVLMTSAYLVSQARWARSIPFETSALERLPVGEFLGFQVSVRELQDRVGLRFADVLHERDVFQGRDAAGLRTLANVHHPRR